MQLAPSEELKHLIRHYLLYYPSSGNSPMRFFPDGNPGIVVPLSNGALPFMNETRSINGAFMVYGMMEHFINIPPPPASGMIIIVLQPYTLGLLTGISSQKLKNKMFTFYELFRIQARFLQNAVKERDNVQDLINLLEKFFLRISEDLPHLDPVLSRCLNHMHHCKGNIQIAALIDRLALSERSLERRFEHFIGVSPKKLTGILRINHFLKLLRSPAPSPAPLQAAIEAGFYDQAHLNHNFKKFTGTTPLEYLSLSDPLAINLFSRQP